MTSYDPDLNPAHDSSSSEMDRLLIAHFLPGEELEPSSGFAVSVMEAVGTKISAPLPVPFPWRRVVPSLVAVLCLMIGLVVVALRELRVVFTADVRSQYRLTSSLQAGRLPHFTTWEQALCWIAASACIAIAVAAGSIWLAGARSAMRM